MKNFYYISGNMGLTSSGSFTRDKSRWINFNQEEVNNIGNNRPYGATKTGVFVDVNKF
jgi:hypothetical protein